MRHTRIALERPVTTVMVFLAVLAVGLEDGGVQVWLASCRPSDDGPHHRLLWSAGPGERHAGAVRRLAWAPARGGGDG